MLKKSYNVQPLRTKEEIDNMKWSLRRFCSERDYYLFLFGINTGLRVSDILSLQVKDVKDRVHIRIVQKKNKKIRVVKIGHFGNYTEDYIKGMADGDYLFASRKGDKPISDTQAYRIGEGWKND